MNHGERIPTLTIPIPSRESARARAIRFLIEGRLTVKVVHNGRAYVQVRGDSGSVRSVVYKQRRWSCSCPARPGTCAHVFAAMSITDLGGPAR